MSDEKERPKETKGVSGLAIPAGALIGMGIGHVAGDFLAGLFIGLGLGFVTVLILRLKLGKW